MDKRFLFTSSRGIDWHIVDDGDQHRFMATGETHDIIEQNKAERAHNDGYSESREFRRAARIPYIVGIQWLNDEGWWFEDAGHDPEVAKKLVAKLNSNEWEHLRTADGRLAVSGGVIR